MAGKPQARDRINRLLVTVNEEERAAIKAAAADARLSVSAYLRALGLGHQPKSVLDLEAVRSLLLVAGDLGRMGGLLKWWLTERPGEGARVEDVRAVLDEIEATQAAVREQAYRV
ncbi:conjugal transfer protein TraJ (plasmid) [Brevundimonas olei]|uniref:Conjugal transfer protein TraJ n=1 Tax=Brevundimonas olei TaxID=657642 RepID=A0ABZ2IHW1_9CAUL